MASQIQVPRRRGRPPKHDGAEVANVRAVDRAVRLLEVLAAGAGGLVFTDLAAQAEMAPSTAHRFLTTLLKHGYVRCDPVTHRWSVGLRLFEIGQSFARNRDVISVSRPKMNELMLQSGETISLALADDQQIIFVAQVETEASIRAFFPPGERGPLHASGCGKAVIATWSDKRIAETVGLLGMRVYTPNTLHSLPSLLEAVTQTRARGWSVNDGEHTPGMRCVAAPIFDGTGRAIAAMSISGPIERISYEMLPGLGRLIRNAAVEITSAIGGYTDFFDPSSIEDRTTGGAGAQHSR